MFRRDPKRRGPVQPATRRAVRGEPARGNGREAAAESAPDERFVLYVEGARDREILAGWARHVAPVFGRTLERGTVILGGRQPARAIDDFARRGGAAAGLAGLVVLDRDDHREGPSASEPERLLAPGLELFVWSLRHIESYLLVPAAIRRVAPHAPDDGTLQAWISGESSPAGRDERANGGARRPANAHNAPHAKRLLGAGGALSEALGTALRPGELARAMRRDELHADVHELFARIAALRGIAVVGEPQVVVRRFARDTSEG